MLISEQVSSCVCVCIHVHTRMYIDIHIIVLIMLYTLLHVHTSNTVLLYSAFLVNDSTCPGRPRHKPFGVSRGSLRSQTVFIVLS